MNCEFGRLFIMELINRVLSNEIKRAITYFPVITITGPRQSGKTTLSKELFPEKPYINLEHIPTREQLIQDTDGFLSQYPDGFIIDEAHHYPDLFSYIQVLVDKYPERRYILTGSSNFALLEKITQSLAGRTAIFKLLPPSLHELKDRIEGVNTDNLILKGTYPAIWSKGIPFDLFYSNYYQTYIERDIWQIVNIKDITLFQKFIRLAAGRIGNECNSSSLSGEVGTAANTITHWFSVLNATYIAYMLPPYYENIGKRLIKTPKIYFYDVGLACYLLRIQTEEQLKTHPLRGNLFENLVINEAIKSRFNKGKDADLFFFRDRSQKEVDLLHVKENNDMHAYEIKSSGTFNKDFLKGIDYLKDIFKTRITRSAILYDGKEEKHTRQNGLYNYKNFELE